MKNYETPKLIPLGTVADLTQTGLTTEPGADAKGGSVVTPGV